MNDMKTPRITKLTGLEDLGCLNDIVKDVGDALEPILVLLERKFTVNGEVQPA